MCSFIQGKKCRSIESIRAKRRRYRKKKTKLKEVLIEDDIRKRWRERRIRAEAEDEIDTEEESVKGPNEMASDLECKSIVKQSNATSQNEQYYKIANEALSSSQESGILLLPLVPVPDRKHESAQEITSKLPLSGLSNVNSVDVVSYIQRTQDKTTNALHLARCYRDLAERLKKEKYETEQKMNDKVEVVRNFWRNNIHEGHTRAGKMVQKALKLHCDH